MSVRKRHSRPSPGRWKELAAAQDAGQPLTPEETERLEASRNRKKNAYQELKAQAETDPAAAVELARRRAYHSEATKKSRQKMYEEAAAEIPKPKPGMKTSLLQGGRTTTKRSRTRKENKSHEKID